MLINRNDLQNLGGVVGYNKASIKATISEIVSILSNKYGITVYKDSTIIKHRGAKIHHYDVQELLTGLKIFNKDLKHKNPLQKKMIIKLIFELREFKLNSAQPKDQKYQDRNNLRIIERLLKKASSVIQYDTQDDYCVSRQTATQGLSHIIKLNANRLRWVSKGGKEGKYDFSTNLQANLWVKKNILKLMEGDVDFNENN